MEMKLKFLMPTEKLTENQIFERITFLNPELVCFVVYGQNVNAGTTNMSGANMFQNI